MGGEGKPAYSNREKQEAKNNLRERGGNPLQEEDTLRDPYYTPPKAAMKKVGGGGHVSRSDNQGR